MIEQIALIPITVLLAIVISQYPLLLKKRKRYDKDFFPPLSVLVPAHNEEKYIGKTISSILASDYKGGMEVIAINDGSTDRTADILKRYSKKIKVLDTDHLGKSRALNKAISISKGDVIVVIDGDTEVASDSIKNLVRPLQEEDVAAVGGIVKVRNKSRPLSWFQNIEYLYSSFFNTLCDKIDSNIFTPGPLSAFKKDRVSLLGGFSAKVFLEDVDMSLRLIRKGNVIRIAEDAVVRTNVPETLRSWARQRKRWMKGGIETIKNHRSILFRRKYRACGLYPFPMLSYWYFHSLLMGIILFFQIFGGYYQYFYLNGDALSMNVFLYFFYWFSILGIFNLINLMISGIIPVSLLSIMSILITAFAYPLYLYPFIKFREKLRIQDVAALFFLFPYWLLVLSVQFFSNIRWIIPTERRNWWIK